MSRPIQEPCTDLTGGSHDIRRNHKIGEGPELRSGLRAGHLLAGLTRHEDELRAATQRFADVLSASPLEKNIHTGLRDQRHVIFDNGTRLMWATTFENDWDPYFEDFVLIGIEHFLDWMQHTTQYPPSRSGSSHPAGSRSSAPTTPTSTRT
jgi:hypothetical protein